MSIQLNDFVRQINDWKESLMSFPAIAVGV